MVREIVWLKGKRAGDEAPMVLVALGADHHFAVVDLKRFAVGDVAIPETGALERARLALQGPRELLARFAGARPDQTVTILAERRPGRADLFVLAVDLCP